jgi:hypothetical protein
MKEKVHNICRECQMRQMWEKEGQLIWLFGLQL